MHAHNTSHPAPRFIVHHTQRPRTIMIRISFLTEHGHLETLRLRLHSRRRIGYIKVLVAGILGIHSRDQVLGICNIHGTLCILLDNTAYMQEYNIQDQAWLYLSNRCSVLQPGWQ